MFDKTDAYFNRSYILETQSDITGGFAKWPQNSPGMNIKYYISAIIFHLRIPWQLFNIIINFIKIEFVFSG